MRNADLPGRNVLWRAVGGQRRDVVVGAVLGMGHQTGEALVPVVIGLAIDRGVVDGDVSGLLLWLGVLAVVYVGLSSSFRFGARAGERASLTAAHRLRTELTARVLAPEGGTDEGRLPGELANTATEDARRVGAVTMALVVGIGAATGLAVGAVVLLRISFPLGLLVLLGTPLLLWLVHLLSKPLERRSETEQERAAHAATSARRAGLLRRARPVPHGAFSEFSWVNAELAQGRAPVPPDPESPKHSPAPRTPLPHAVRTPRTAPHHRNRTEGPPMFRSRTASRLAAALASTLLLLTAATACGGDDSGSDSTDSGAKAGASGESAFPVTIAHKYGSTTIKAEPQRIVTVGLTDQDAVLALGKVPVGTTEWLGGYKGAIGPWAEDELGGAEAPTVLKDTGTGPQVEKIAALKPDLILALYGGLTKEQYESLSKFAPVVAQPKEYNDYGIPWQELTRKVGQALGKPDEATKVVEDTEATIKAAADEHPEFKGAGAVMATPYEGMFVFGSQDARSRILTDLGFSLPKDLDKAIGDKFGANISKERTDLLDQDAVVWIAGDVAKDADKLHKDASYKDLNVVKEGREVFVDESSDYGHATSFVSALSLPYVVERLAPQLAAAVDGKPDTKVEQPAS